MAPKKSNDSLLLSTTEFAFDPTIGEGFPCDQRKPELASLYEQQCQLYQKQREDLTPADREWFRKITSPGGGTASDRCSALSLAVQEAPAFGLPHLKQLLDIAQSEKHHTSLLALEHLTDVFSKVYFPCTLSSINNDDDKNDKDKRKTTSTSSETRKLLYLNNRPDYQDKSKLLRWYIEDSVKEAYFQYLQLGEKYLKSNIEHDREQIARLLFTCAATNGHEQTTNIVSLFISKLGDPCRKLASRMIYYLEELSKYHKDLHPMIVQSVCTFLVNLTNHDSLSSERSLFYGTTFLCQIKFSHRQHPDLADTVMQAYAALFSKHVVPTLLQFEREKRKIERKKLLLDVKVELEKLQCKLIPRLTKPLLTGINRAIPYVKIPPQLMQDALIKLANQSNLASSLPALSLLYQVSSKLNDMSTFGKVLCENTLGRLNTVSSSTVGAFLKLIEKILDGERTQGRLKLSCRILMGLLKLSLGTDSSITASILLHVAHALHQQPGLRVMITMPAIEYSTVIFDPSTFNNPTDTMYELNILSLHPNPLIASLAKAILNQEWDNKLFKARSNLLLLDSSTNNNSNVDFLEVLSQWRCPLGSSSCQKKVDATTTTTTINAAYPELQFLDDLRPIMERNRPKCRVKDNNRQRPKKSSSSTFGEDEEEERFEDESTAFDFEDDEDMQSDNNEDGSYENEGTNNNKSIANGGCFADQADYLEQIASDYEGNGNNENESESEGDAEDDKEVFDEEEQVDYEAEEEEDNNSGGLGEEIDDDDDEDFEELDEESFFEQAMDGLIEVDEGQDESSMMMSMISDNDENVDFDDYEDIDDSMDEIVFDAQGNSTSSPLPSKKGIVAKPKMNNKATSTSTSGNSKSKSKKPKTKTTTTKSKRPNKINKNRKSMSVTKSKKH